MNLQFDQTFHELLVGSYQRFVGQSLLPRGLNAEASARWLYADAAFAVLAHNSAPDPIFTYGNQAAQRLFEYPWDELIALPSRLSAEAPEREERERFLERVRADGFVTGYSGVRITKSGARFRITNATVWQLVDDEGGHHGQAAALPQWQLLLSSAVQTG
jgi:PAS domain-containing protein